MKTRLNYEKKKSKKHFSRKHFLIEKTNELNKVDL